MIITMKLKFWKRSINKSKAAKASKGKRHRKSKGCTECESLRTTVDGEFNLPSFLNISPDQLIMLINFETVNFFLFIVQSYKAIVTK